MKHPAAHRVRAGCAALSAVLATSTLGACARGPEPGQPPVESVPRTLAPRPSNSPQPPARLLIDEPTWVLNGYADSSGEAVWRQSTELVSEWLLNPDHMTLHPVTSRTELDGLADLMTDEAAARWKKQAHRAITPYIGLPYKGGKFRRQAEAQVGQLVLWNLIPPRNRGWDNPMLGPVHITEGKVIGAQSLGVIFRVRTSLRMRGQGKLYKVPYITVLTLIWRRVDGEWKLDDWRRSVRLKAEKEIGAEHREDVLGITQGSGTPSPTASPTPIPSAP